MMKANNQLGFININEDSIDKIIKDDEVIFERGFLREKTSTTLPITFGGVGKDLKDYRVYGNTYQNSTSGKNLYNQIINKKQYGLTIVGDKDKIAINGEQTSTDQKIELGSATLPPGTYTIMIEDLNGMSNLSGWIYIKDTWNRPTSTGLYVNSTTSKRSVTFTLTQANTITYGMYLVTYRPTYNSLIRLSLVSGSTEDYDFEPYTGGQPSPNPDYPQEIVSCGDRTKNKFLVPNSLSNGYRATYSKINNNSFSLNYNQATSDNSSSYARIDFDITQFKPNTRYTISKKHIVSGNNFSNAGAIRSYINGSNGSVITGDSFAFTTPNEITSLGVYFYLGYNNTIQGESTITFYDIQIEENSSATPYEPYGYKIPVNVRSDNLFDKDDINIEDNKYLISDGSYSDNSNFKTTDYIPVKSSTIYNLSPYRNYSAYECFYDENKTFISSIQIKNINNTFTTPSNAKYIRLSVRKTDNDGLILVEGSATPTKYQPYYNETTNIYLDEPLRKIDGYSDYIDFINGKVVRQLGEVVLDENSALSVIEIITSNNKFIWRYTTALDIIGSGARSNILSNNYIGDTTVYSANNKIGAYVNSNGITNFATLLSTVGATTNSTITQVLNLLKTWLSLHHTELIYPLATPTEESITLPNIPTVEGNNTLNIETEITPSQVYIKYKSNN